MIIESIKLNSSFSITLLDQTRHYYGGYYHVKLLAYCEIPLEQGYFESLAEFNQATEKMGHSVRFERVLEKMAVSEPEIENVRKQLVNDFNETAASYLATADFIPRFVRSEYLKCMKKTSQIRSHRV